MLRNRIWCAGILLCLIINPLHATESYTTYLLNSHDTPHQTAIISLEDGLRAQTTHTTIDLNRHQSAELDSRAADQLRANGPLVADIPVGHTPVPGRLAASHFVIPHGRGEHLYDLLSPEADANVTVTVGTESQTHNLLAGEVLTINAGSDNTTSALIDSDQPLLVVHRSRDGRDRYAVVPPARQLYGLGPEILLGAQTDGTTVTAWLSDGSSQTVNLNRGERHLLSLDVDAVYLEATQPIAAIAQSAQSNTSIAFWPQALLGHHHALPSAADTLTVLCTQTTAVNLSQGTAQNLQTCHPNTPNPGTVTFNAVAAGAVLSADQPIYALSQRSDSALIVDNEDPDTHQTGTWTPSVGVNPYGEESRYSNSGATFRWQPKLPQGRYRVLARWTYHPNRSDQVPYHIDHRDGQSTVTRQPTR